jgi:hypothetical protein
MNCLKCGGQLKQSEYAMTLPPTMRLMTCVLCGTIHEIVPGSSGATNAPSDLMVFLLPKPKTGGSDAG